MNDNVIEDTGTLASMKRVIQLTDINQQSLFLSQEDISYVYTNTDGLDEITFYRWNYWSQYLQRTTVVK